jgi:hypothetical protein
MKPVEPEGAGAEIRIKADFGPIDEDPSRPIVPSRKRVSL